MSTNKEKKYEFTDETMLYCGKTLHRIKALKNFNDVKEGDLGGWIESENNLSHNCNCWVYNEAKVFGRARVLDNAKVYNHTILTSNSIVTSDIANNIKGALISQCKLFPESDNTVIGYAAMEEQYLYKYNYTITESIIVGDIDSVFEFIDTDPDSKNILSLNLKYI